MRAGARRVRFVGIRQFSDQMADVLHALLVRELPAENAWLVLYEVARVGVAFRQKPDRKLLVVFKRLLVSGHHGLYLNWAGARTEQKVYPAPVELRNETHKIVDPVVEEESVRVLEPPQAFLAVDPPVADKASKAQTDGVASGTLHLLAVELLVRLPVADPLCGGVVAEEANRDVGPFLEVEMFASLDYLSIRTARRKVDLARKVDRASSHNITARHVRETPLSADSKRDVLRLNGTPVLARERRAVETEVAVFLRGEDDLRRRPGLVQNYARKLYVAHPVLAVRGIGSLAEVTRRRC